LDIREETRLTLGSQAGQGGEMSVPRESGNLIDELLAGNISRRQFIRSATLMGMSLSATMSILEACASNPTSTSSGPRRGGDLVIARPRDNTTMDPAVAVELDTIYMINHVFETLYATAKDGKSVVPWLAQSHTLSSDQLTWTFTLRAVKFSDGSPMTSADVKWSLERAKAEKAGFGFLLSSIETIEAPNPGTVVIKTKFPWKPLQADLTLWTGGILPKEFGGKSADEFFKKPIGTGPFVLDHWTRGQELKAVRNTNYWQANKPFVDSVTWTLVPDDNTRLLQLQGGKIHINPGPSFGVLDSLKNTPGVKVEAFPGTSIFLMLINTRKKPFDDVHVRRAMAYAIDRDAMAKAALFGYGQPAYSMVAPTAPFFDPNTPYLPFDLAKAKAELAQTSVPTGFSTQFNVGGSDVFQVTIGEILQQQLAKIGIQVTLRKVDPGQIYGLTASHDYQLSYENISMDVPDPDEAASIMLDPVNGGLDSYNTGYNNPKAIALVQAAEKEFDDTKRADLYKQIQALQAQEVPQITLVFGPNAFSFRDTVNGFFVNPMGNRHLEDVWLSK
jgi:peptide/nickel transport system substrate-binding protein